MLEPPQDIAGRVAAPTEVGRVPTEKILPPIRQHRRVRRVGRPPPPRDRVANEIQIDPPPLRLLDQLRMSQLRVRISPRNRLIGAEPQPRGPDSLASASQPPEQ